MNTNICEDCNKTTGGRCWKHSSETVVLSPLAHPVFVDTSSALKTALQKLVDRLELIQKDEYFHSLRGLVFSQWKNELAEAKKVLEESSKPPVVLCTGYTTRDVDLFDNRQIEIDFTPQETPELNEYAKKVFKCTHGVELSDDDLKPLKYEEEE